MSAGEAASTAGFGGRFFLSPESFPHRLPSRPCLLSLSRTGSLSSLSAVPSRSGSPFPSCPLASSLLFPLNECPLFSSSLPLLSVADCPTGTHSNLQALQRGYRGEIRSMTGFLRLLTVPLALFSTSEGCYVYHLLSSALSKVAVCPTCSCLTPCCSSKGCYVSHLLFLADEEKASAKYGETGRNFGRVAQWCLALVAVVSVKGHFCVVLLKGPLPKGGGPSHCEPSLAKTRQGCYVYHIVM